MKLMRELDPHGVGLRRSRRLSRRTTRYNSYLYADYCFAPQGPNFIWHIDGYDKLSRFAFMDALMG